jgi:hypothetical protein
MSFTTNKIGPRAASAAAQEGRLASSPKPPPHPVATLGLFPFCLAKEQRKAKGKAEEVEEEGKRKAPTGVGAGRRRAEDDAVDATADWVPRGITLEREPVKLRNATRELCAIVASSSSSRPAGEGRMRRHREKLHQVVALIVRFTSSWTPSPRRQQQATLPGAEGAHHLLDVMPACQAAQRLLHRVLGHRAAVLQVLCRLAALP